MSTTHQPVTGATTMSNPTTVTVTEIRPEGDERIRFQRDYPTAASAQRGLLTAIERETREWGAADDISWLVAEREAKQWDRDTCFAQTVHDWAKRGRKALRFTVEA